MFLSDALMYVLSPSNPSERANTARNLGISTALVGCDRKGLDGRKPTAKKRETLDVIWREGKTRQMPVGS